MAAKPRKSVAKQTTKSAPRASRPVVPAGYGFPTKSSGLLDWSWARERLTNFHNYVIVTVRPDGRPHAMGMHGLWVDDAYYFGTDVATRKAKNLAQNTNCIVICENFEEMLIMEGTAQAISYDNAPAELSQASKAKYGWPMAARKGMQIYRVTPRVVFAFPLQQLVTAVTRWKFK
jgi:Pyridoxamine 5'-phosphate oxidase